MPRIHLGDWAVTRCDTRDNVKCVARIPGRADWDAPFCNGRLRGAIDKVSIRVEGFTMRVGYLQFGPEFGKISDNLKTIENIALNRARDADLLVLPELASTGYLFGSREELLSMAEPASDGPTVKCLARIARELSAVVVGGFAERDGDLLYNSCALVREDGSVHVYRKAHLFMNEKDLFEPGDTPFETVRGAGTDLGLMVCFDWYYPEVTRLLAINGAKIICHPSNLVLPHCPDAMKVRSLENRIFSITANRVGRDENAGQSLEFIGMSQITGPDGKVILRAPSEGVHVGIAEIDPTEAETKDLTGRNIWTEDRRVDLFGGLV